MDMVVDAHYQRVHMPEIVNSTQDAVDIILVFEHSPDELRRLYHVRVSVHDSLPVWLDNHGDPSYLVGSYYNVVEEVLVVRAGVCSELLRNYRDEKDRKYDTALSQTDLSNFLAQCPALIRISGKEMEALRRSADFYPKVATCLVLNNEGDFTPVRESDLSWYGLQPTNGSHNHLLSICADPKASEKESLF